MNYSEIRLCINDAADLYNRYSVLPGDGQAESFRARMNDELMAYLKDMASDAGTNALLIFLEMREGLRIEADSVARLIKRHASDKARRNHAVITKINRNSTLLTLVGMLLIAYTQVSHLLPLQYSLNEFVVIVAWVFMWTAVELFFFDKAKLAKENKLLARICEARVVPRS